jgi:hypothetical protein
MRNKPRSHTRVIWLSSMRLCCSGVTTRSGNPMGEPPQNRQKLPVDQVDLLAHYWANCGDLDTPLISKATFWSLTEPWVLSSISVPTSSRVNHLSVVTA